MKCPYCGHADSKVNDSRTTDDNSVIRRRRYCEECSGKFTTYERLDLAMPVVLKKNNTREAFDRNKVLQSIMRACDKRQIPLSTIEKTATEIEEKIINSLKKEIETTEIGNMVLEKMKSLDDVAYIRFASVYKSFKDIDSFIDEIVALNKDKP